MQSHVIVAAAAALHGVDPTVMLITRGGVCRYAVVAVAVLTEANILCHELLYLRRVAVLLYHYIPIRSVAQLFLAPKNCAAVQATVQGGGGSFARHNAPVLLSHGTLRRGKSAQKAKIYLQRRPDTR
jgi:hypothetical protein